MPDIQVREDMLAQVCIRRLGYRAILDWQFLDEHDSLKFHIQKDLKKKIIVSPVKT